MNPNANRMKHKRVLIVGLGKSGIAAIGAMLHLQAQIAVQDSKPEEKIDKQLLIYLKSKNITCFFGCVPENMEDFDMIILSPGVSPELPFIQEAKAKNVEIIGELEIAYRTGEGRYVAITGTNGKTTTTTLVGEIFELSKRNTHVVGNIGVAVISASLDAKPEDWLVTETSSFQLETTRDFRPEVSAILNLTPDHLNRHHTMEGYGAAKAKIFENQTEDQYLIINKDDAVCFALAKDCKAKVVPFSRKEELEFGTFIKDDAIVIRDESGEIKKVCDIADIRIIGEHNLENVLAAAAICYFAGIEIDVINKGIAEFGGVEHRIEFTRELDGVKYYNDSKGTNTDASITAIKALKDNIILIAGGDSKSQNFDEFVTYLDPAVKEMILLGRDAHFIEEAARKVGYTNMVYCKDMDDCVRQANKDAVPGDKVLLSPACASWDMYQNFEQRGEHFKDCVHRL